MTHGIYKGHWNTLQNVVFGVSLNEAYLRTINFGNIKRQRLTSIAKDLIYTGRLNGMPIFIRDNIELGFRPENHDIL